MGYKTDVVYKVTKEAKGKDIELGNLYFKDVPVTFACLHKPKKKYNSEDTAWSINLFIDAESMKKLDKIGLNKEMAEVGVTKIKKGNNRGDVKYKLDDTNKDYEGMFAAQFSRNSLKRDAEGNVTKTYQPVTVVDQEGKPFKENVGNGSICHVKLFSYRNTEDMLVVMLDTVVVVEHVPYEGGSDSFDEELGITIPQTDIKDVKSGVSEGTAPTPADNSDDDIPF